jgi:lipopolysaccharide transport system ATP-binding protein
VASLLEVGTGFHLQLTGRENVYLNGAILGMSRAEIDRKLDQIVDFAEVDTFLDTPVKHYSSGMQLRLAFSVAAHLEPEILLVDEVLAVGDAAFQKKCLGKVEHVARQGRTVLFVSHNLGVVRELCERAMVLAGGRLVFDGGVVDGLRRYADSLEPTKASDAEPADRGWHVAAVNGRVPQASIPLAPTQPLTIDAWLELRDRLVDVSLFCIITDSVGDLVVHQRVDRGEWPGEPTPGRHDVHVDLPPLWLAPGLYTLSFKLIGRTADNRDERLLSPPVLLDVTGADGRVGRARLAPPLRWTIRRSEPARDHESSGALSRT